MIEYAKAIGANSEVIQWCNTVLKSAKIKNDLDVGEMEHIIDYLSSDAAPKRLRKMSYKQAKISSEKWTKSQQKKGRDLVDDESDIESIHNFEDGTKIVKLLTKKAYHREGFLMAQCVGGYDPNNSTIYSYRDKNNNPHATFEVSKEGDEIVQIKGKGNGSIHPKYIYPILAFLKEVGMDIRPNDMINLGYRHITARVEEIFSLFVDAKGNSPKYLDIFGEKYLEVT